MLRAQRLGSPPAWDDAPPEFQVDLACLDTKDDQALWHIARSHRSEAELARYDELLDRSAQGLLTPAERTELERLRRESDLFTVAGCPEAAVRSAPAATAPARLTS
ncbi:hypothetical protein [Sorangium sp. So ce1389]|uniref:hypothetical protein n=1 Tax=Sorangium sp. So ce1389 TaxID=3133336 RepID=UPI003F63608E